MRLRPLAVALLAVLPALTVAGNPATAQTSPCAVGISPTQYPPSQCGLSLSKTVVVRGESLDVAGAGYAGNSDVALEFRSAPAALGSARTGVGGSFTRRVVVPSDATLGAHTIAGVGTNVAGRPLTLTAGLTVVATDVARDSGLPRTGAGLTVPLVIAALVLIALGCLAVLAVRRRRAAA